MRTHRHDATRRLATLAATAIAALAATSPAALAGDTRDAVAVDTDKTLMQQQLSAHDARRAGYRYLGALGYARTSGIGSARVRSVTREGNVWILRVAFGNGSRVQSRTAVLYVDAVSALVSEVAPSGINGQVAAK